MANRPRLNTSERWGVTAIVAVAALAGIVAGLIAANIAEDSQESTWRVNDTMLCLFLGVIAGVLVGWPLAIREGRRWARARTSRVD